MIPGGADDRLLVRGRCSEAAVPAAERARG